jgi:predicted nucleic acid-binding protein
MKFVLDNSVAMRWFFGDGKPKEISYAKDVLENMRRATALVPAIWGLEVSNVIAKAEAKGLVTEARSSIFLEMLKELDIEADVQTYSRSLDDILNIARRYGLSAYDASYLELALREDISLATLDEDLMKSAKKAGAKVY